MCVGGGGEQPARLFDHHPHFGGDVLGSQHFGFFPCQASAKRLGSVWLRLARVETSARQGPIVIIPRLCHLGITAHALRGDVVPAALHHKAHTRGGRIE